MNENDRKKRLFDDRARRAAVALGINFEPTVAQKVAAVAYASRSDIAMPGGLPMPTWQLDPTEELTHFLVDVLHLSGTLNLEEIIKNARELHAKEKSPQRNFEVP